MADSFRLHADSTPPPSDGCPSQLGRYEVIGQIGAGGMARAYLAVQRDAQPRLVAIKLLRPEVMEETELRDMFRNEARVSVLLHHPNVVRTFEVGSTEQLYLVLEYLEGQSLGSLYRQIPRKDVSTRLQIYILAEVLAGLQHAHTRVDLDGSPLGLVHRDISPSNIFLTTAGEVKVLDFGIAKVAGSQTITRAGTVKGKLGYAAPEQLIGAPVDCRADIFAVGTLLWEALAGRRRVVAETVSAVTFARIQGQEVNLEDVSPETPEVLRKICARALATDVQQRYESADAMRGDLLNYLLSEPADAYQTQLARLVSDTFEPELAARRRAISEHLELGASRSATTIPAIDAPDGTPSQRTPSSERYVSGAPSSARDLASMRDGLSHSVHAAPQNKRWQSPVLISSALALSVGLVFAARIHGVQTLSATISQRSDLASGVRLDDAARQVPQANLPAPLTAVRGGAQDKQVAEDDAANQAKASLQNDNAHQPRAAALAPEGVAPKGSAVSPTQLAKPAQLTDSTRQPLAVRADSEGVGTGIAEKNGVDSTRPDTSSRRSKRRRQAEAAAKEAEANAALSERVPGERPVEAAAAPHVREAAPGDSLMRVTPRRALRAIDEADPYKDVK